MAKRKTTNIYTFFVDSDSEYLDDLVLGFHDAEKYEVKSFYSVEDFLVFFERFQFPKQSIVMVVMGFYFESRKWINSSESGVEALKVIKEIMPNTHVIMISKEEELILKSKAIRFGADEVLLKNDLLILKLSNLFQKIISHKRLYFVKYKVILFTILFASFAILSLIILFVVSKLV